MYYAASSLTDESYVPNTWLSIQRAREIFAASLGGPQGFDRWVLNAMTINPSEAYGTHSTVEKIWRKFRSTFEVSSGLLRYIPIYAVYIREFLRAAIEDGVLYIEARVNFLSKYMVGVDGQENIPHREWVLIFDDAVNEIKAEME